MEASNGWSIYHSLMYTHTLERVQLENQQEEENQERGKYRGRNMYGRLLLHVKDSALTILHLD